MLSKEQKKKIVAMLGEELGKARGVVFCAFQGLPAPRLQELRARLRRENVRYQVVKLTLLKRILRQVGIDASKFNYQVPVAVSFSFTDEVAPAKILHDFGRTHESLKILSGILDHQFIDAAEVKGLAILPGKKELQARVVFAIASPLRGLISVLTGNIRGLINVLNAYSEVRGQKSEVG